MKNYTKARLLADIEFLSTDKVWNTYTRSALELRWAEFTKNAVCVVYMDIDHMHDLNSKYGHSGTDNRIKEVIAKVRHTGKGRIGDIVASRWLNGDEVIFILNSGECELFCKRMQREFKRVGISVTMAYTNRITDNPFTTIDPCDTQVNQYKRVDMRGVIIPVYKES